MSENNWMPIASAPRDRPVLVYNSVTNSYVTAYNDVAGKEWPMRGWGTMAGVWFPQPTHWMPLPSPPESP